MDDQEFRRDRDLETGRKMIADAIEDFRQSYQRDREFDRGMSSMSDRSLDQLRIRVADLEEKLWALSLAILSRGPQ
jgi:hypothetical protein